MKFVEGSRIYLDTNIWIYLLSPPSNLEAAIRSTFSEIEVGNVSAVTSILSWAECLILPIRNDHRQE